MAIRSFRSRKFRRCLESLLEHVQALAYESFLLWKRDPGHPSLQFKKVSGDNWSARVGLHYRAIGRFVRNGSSGNGLALMATTIGWRSTVTSTTPIGSNERNLPTKHTKHAKGFGDFGSGISFASIRACRAIARRRRVIRGQYHSF